MNRNHLKEPGKWRFSLSSAVRQLTDRIYVTRSNLNSFYQSIKMTVNRQKTPTVSMERLARKHMSSPKQQQSLIVFLSNSPLHFLIGVSSFFVLFFLFKVATRQTCWAPCRKSVAAECLSTCSGKHRRQRCVPASFPLPSAQTKVTPSIRTNMRMYRASRTSFIRINFSVYLWAC